jgi:hypothetical protein
LISHYIESSRGKTTSEPEYSTFQLFPMDMLSDFLLPQREKEGGLLIGHMKSTLTQE